MGLEDSRLGEPLEHSEEKLKDALHLSTMWGFKSVREYAIKEISTRFSDPATTDPFDRLELADKCDVSQWRLPEYLKICRRKDPITMDEGMRLGWKRFVALSRVREQAPRVYFTGTEMSLADWIPTVDPYLELWCRYCGAKSGSYRCEHMELSDPNGASWDPAMELIGVADQLDI